MQYLDLAYIARLATPFLLMMLAFSLVTREATADEAPVGAVSGWDISLARPGDTLGVEASVLWPIFPGSLYQARAAVNVSPRGSVLIGLQGHIPHDREEEGEFSSLALHAGWRQWLGLGFHLDGVVNAGLGRLRDSTINGQDYTSFDVEFMALAGWSASLGRVYILLQPVGVAAVVYKSNPWPIQGETGEPTTEGPIYVGNVSLGYAF